MMMAPMTSLTLLNLTSSTYPRLVTTYTHPKFDKVQVQLANTKISNEKEKKKVWKRKRSKRGLGFYRPQRQTRQGCVWWSGDPRDWPSLELWTPFLISFFALSSLRLQLTQTINNSTFPFSPWIFTPHWLGYVTVTHCAVRTVHCTQFFFFIKKKYWKPKF